MQGQLIERFRRSEAAYKLIVIILSSLLFSQLPIVGFLMYMEQNGIFSYDLFAGGLFGLNVFFGVTLLTIITLSIALTGVIVPAIALISERKQRSSMFLWVVLLGIAILNVYSQWVLISGVNSGRITGSLGSLFVLDFVCAVTTLHIASLIFLKPLHQLITLGTIAIAIIVLSIYCRDTVAELVRSGLTKFSVGGGHNVIIRDLHDSDRIISQGRLVLLSPNNVFIRSTAGVRIVERSTSIVIEISEK